MSFAPESNLRVAQDLIDLESGAATEEYCRSIASRCYYAAYGLIRKELEALVPALFGKSGRHSTLAMLMSQSNDPHIARMGVRLTNLKVAREEADYEFSAVVSEVGAETALRRAKTLIAKARELSGAQKANLVGNCQANF